MRATDHGTMGKPADKRIGYLIGLMLALCTFAVFGRMLGHEFLNCDDPVYVTANAHVQGGLTLAGVRWAFSTMDACFYQPLVWISYMLDRSMFGPEPPGFLLTNLILHVLNSLILFAALNRMTGHVWRSGFVAALFALHPLHVESVAWIAERKDVLSTLFWMLTVWAYVRYAEFKVQGSRFKVGAHLSVIVLFGLGLMSKPMLVTLPFVLLLLDHWPLGRVGAKHLQEASVGGDSDPRSRRPRGHSGIGIPSYRGESANALPLLIEKIPLFLLAGGAVLVAFLAQGKGGALGSLDEFPLGIRIANALVAYAAYIGKMVYPLNLAPFYPQPEGLPPAWQIVGSALLLAGITALAFLWARRRPYLVVGWLWYVVTLLPVSGIVRFGAQTMADRYTYIPLVGLFIMLAWGIPEWLNGRMGEWGNGRTQAPILPFVLSPILLLTLLAFRQVGYWHNNVTVYTRSLEVAPHNYLAWNNLGAALEEKGGLDEAIRCYRQALRIEPRQARAHNNLGNIFIRQGRWDDAVHEYRKAVGFRPRDPMLHNNLAVALTRKGMYHEAIMEYAEALSLAPDLPDVRTNMAETLLAAGDYPGAWRAIHKSIECGGRPPDELVEKLRRAMPEPEK